MTNEQIYDVNWDAINAEVDKSLPTGKYGRNEKTIFLKLPIGIHRLRIVPSGNATEQLPYLKIAEHTCTIPDPARPGERGKFTSVLCWRHLYENLISKKSDEEKKKNSLIAGYLGANNLLDQDNYRKYKEFGCAWCKAHSFLNMHGVEQEVRSNFWPRDAIFWNVIYRQGTTGGDNKVYIWRQSKTQFNVIINTLKIIKDAGVSSYLDVNTGRDMMIQATGMGLARRYPILQFMGEASPLNIGEETPHSLEANVLGKGYRTYQDSVNILKQAYGKVLAAYGHIIQGDQIINEQYTHNNSLVAPVVNAAVQEAVPPYIPVLQAPTGSSISPYKEGDEIVVVNGKLVNKRTGQEMF